MGIADFTHLSERQRAIARHNAIAFSIWRACQPIAWNVTAAEVAEATGYKLQSIINVALKKGWISRFRAGVYDTNTPGRFGPATPRPLDDFFAGPDDLSLLAEVA